MNKVMNMRVLRLPSRLKLSLPFAGLLCSTRWFDTDVSGLAIGPIIKGFKG